MELKVKRLSPDAKLPSKAHSEDIGWDLCCVADEDFCDYTLSGSDKFFILDIGESHIFHTGIACEIETGFAAFLWDRSGMGAKRNIHRLAGVIDSTYRGEWLVCLVNLSQQPQVIKAGDKIIQAVIQRVEDCTVTEVDELSETERAEGGFASAYWPVYCEPLLRPS
jgi:dUTP pyrophosphatase